MSVVKKNSSHTIDITGMTHEGQGVGRIDNFTVFADGAIPGERVEVKIIKVTKSYAVGKLVRIIKASENRTEPFCSAYKRCGGCTLQHMNYESQLSFKTGTVREALKRIGGVDAVVHGTIGMNDPRYYRNKAQYPVGMSKNGLVSGFYAQRSHEIIENDVCAIQDRISGVARALVIEHMKKFSISSYDEKTGTGLVRHIMTRVGFNTGEIMVVIVANGKSLPHAEQLVDALTRHIPSICSIVINVNMARSNIILGEQNIFLYGKETITDYIGKYKFRISPMSFFQVNPVQTEVLYRKVLEYAGLTGSETVFDLYCGAGTISLFLSEKARKVYGVEVVEQAVLDARYNVKANNVSNVEIIEGEAEVEIPRMYEQGIRADVVVLDPPRKGCEESLLQTLVNMQPSRVVYVSCNPSTLARDIKFLDSSGYKVVGVQPVDMFPHTSHVESIVLMTNCGLKDK